MKTKSQISIQFSWIFILIAGAIILLFFASLVYKQQTLSEQKLSASVLNQLETILTGSGLSPGTINAIDTPELELNFICDQDGYSEYSIKGTALTKEIPYDLIFAPELIKGKKLITWALEFDAPFKVTNFLYLSAPDIKYVLVRPDSDFAREVVRGLPENEIIIQEVITLGEVITDGYRAVKLIFFEDDPAIFQIPWSDEIDTSAIQLTTGTISFYKRNSFDLEQEGTPIAYLDMPSLYGAFFSKDLEFYECNMKKAFRKLSLVAEIYADRENNLKSHFQANPSILGCELYYQNKILNLLSDSTQCNQNLRTCISNIISDVSDIMSNQEVLIRKTCPLLY